MAQHILRYWETRLPQLKPMQRAGNRRYYRPADVELVRKIHHLLNDQGYTVKGVQQLLRDRSASVPQSDATAPATPPESGNPALQRLAAIREKLAAALRD